MPKTPGLMAWASARSAVPATVEGDTLDQLIMWRMHDPRYIGQQFAEGHTPMPQRQWTIEARADFADQGKNDAITQAIRTAAVHVNAVMTLLSDGQRPQVVAFSDDFFAGHEEIKLLEDTLGKAKAATADVEDTEVSEDMMSALRDMPKQNIGDGKA